MICTAEIRTTPRFVRSNSPSRLPPLRSLRARHATEASLLNTIPDLNALPVRVDRRRGAELVTQFIIPVAPRTLESWPLTWRHVNGKALVETVELFAVAQAKLDAAPSISGVRRRIPAPV